ncbi:MAG: DUF1289 domain-containing protein [Gammaproteobacteria bacterium]|jgi:uncharacterized protein|nr:DUF1289 domain-containing protein [Gammaproteobacteria bacterium]
MLELLTMKEIQTPCIGICSTTSFGDKICRGCKRFNFEVINWNSYSEQEKLAVFGRIDLLTEQILRNKFRIFSVEKLQDVMHDFRFFYHPDLSSYCWMHGLLQKYSYKIESLDEIGVELINEFKAKPLDEVMNLINEELHLLSEAHFQRYFQR